MSGGVRKIAQVAVGAVIGFVQGGPVGAAIGAGLAFYMAEQQEKLSTKSPLRDNEPSAQTVRSSKAPARYILGRVSTGGVLVWAQEQAGDQTDGEWLHLVYVLCEGPVDALENIYLGEEEIATYGEHASYELIVNPTQVNAFLKANCPDWKDEQIGRGLSFVRLSLKYSTEKFPSGIPDARFIVRGRNDIYDPRTGMAVYTENTALHILWFLRNRCGVPDDEIVFETFASGANVCDESVGNPDDTTSPRYRSSCVIGADEQRTSVLQKLEAACGGRTIRVGGRWMFQAGAYYGPFDFEVTEDMVVGTITGSTEPTNDAAINTVRGTFIDTAQSWTETDYPEVSIAQWVVEDGGEAAETLSFSYVTDAYQAQRLANIELRRRRAGGTISVPMNFLGYNCRPGRAVRVNLPSLNILGEFIVTNWSMGADQGCTAQLQQYEAAQFDDAVGQPYNPIGFINMPAGGLGSPTNVAWTPAETAEVSQGVLSWVQPAGIVTGYAVTVRQGGTAVQAQQVPETTLQLPIAGLPSGNYTMSVAALGPLTRSGEASITVSIDGPPIPESCVVQATIDTITLIPGNTLHGLNGGTYEYFFSTNPQAAQGDYLGQGLTLTHTGLAFATNYAYFVRSKNAYGVSAFLKVVASTSTDVTNMLDALKDKIENGQLAPAMREEIALISGPPSLPGSVNGRLKELDDQVTEITDQLGEQINQVQSDLQEQIDAVADLADSMPYDPAKAYALGQAVLGADGKLYQAKQAVPANNPPPSATYWTDVGQAVQTANGLAARVNTVETKVTEQDGKLTAQATRIDGVQSSLTVTNQNVTAAQQAADAANTLAGGKGKVIIQSAAPAAADRLAQNLWIDTTGNANTPKRWSGSAWVAVTDKAATDAAAAAANALAVAQTKADATVVDTLSSRVTQQGDTITSQGQALTGLQNSLITTNQNVTAAQQAAQDAATLAGGKGKVIVQSAAPAVADRLAQNLWIDTTANANTPKRWSGSAWVAVTDKVATDAAAAAASALTQVATKADASTVQQLSNTVTQQGQTISAQGTSLTNIQATVGNIGGNGSNLLPDTYSWLASTNLPVIASNTGMAKVGVAVPEAASGFGVKTTSSSTSTALYIELTPSNNAAGWNIPVEPGKYLLSFYASSPGEASVRCSLYDGSTRYSVTQALTTARVRYSHVVTVTAATKVGYVIYPNMAGISGTEVTFDSFMIEKMIGENTSPSPFSPGMSAVQVGALALATQSLDARTTQTEQGLTAQGQAVTQLQGTVAGKADASALNALSQTVTQQGQTITAQGSDITNIKASLSNVAGENLLLDPSFASSNGLTNVPAATVVARNDAAVPAGAPSSRVLRLAIATSTGNTYFGFSSALNVRPPESSNASQIAVAGGETYDFELYAFSSVARQHGLWIQFYDAAGTSVGHNWVVAAGDGVRLATVAGVWTKLTGQATVPAGCVRMAMTFRMSAGDTADVFLSSPVARKRAGQDNAQASALQAVDVRVGNAEGALTSQGSAITQLNNTVAGKADNSALQALQSTVTQQGSTLTSQGQAVTQLQSTIGGIGGSGSNLLADDYSWLTSTTLPGTVMGSSLARAGVAVAAADSGFGYLCTFASAATGQFIMLSPTNNVAGWNVRIEPGVYLVSMYMQGSADGSAMVSLYNGTHRQSGNVPYTTERARITLPITVSDSAKVGITIYPNRTGVAAGQTVTIDSVMIEKRVGESNTPSPFVAGPSARAVSGQATAISQLNTTVIQQGTAITAQAERLDGIYVQVNPEMEGDSSGLAGATGSFVGVWTEQSGRIEDGIATGKRIDTVQSQVGGVEGSIQAVSATVQQVSETIAGVDGRVSAMTTIKAETISGGRRVMAGLALGSDGQTAEILAYAQRFAIVDESSGQVTLPFVVSNGQVFINQAVINQAFIQNIVAGMTIRSQAVNSQGLPLLELNFVTGAVSIRGQDANGSSLINNGGLYVYDANGTQRTAIGRLG